MITGIRTSLTGILFLFCSVTVGFKTLPAAASELTQEAADTRGPLPAREAIKQMHFPEGVEVQLVASEPLIRDPVAMKFDHQGVLWVVEMPDYPIPENPESPKQGTIKRLQDLDGDGFYETGTVFADGLDFATGLMLWKSGVIVTLAGKVVHLLDSDGDGVADRREVLIEGFAEQNTQLRANHPSLGMDGSIYIANGLRGGVVHTPKSPGNQVSLQGSDLRYDPVSQELESLTGVGQFGLTFDDWGNRFVCSNRNPAIQMVFERRDLARNRLAVISSSTVDVAKSGERSAIYPISKFWTTSNLHEGQFTAACGVLFFRGDQLGVGGEPQLLTCDPTGNLVHREILNSRGMIYKGRPGREGVEFLASTDTWFRPVNLEHGPDGCLYVVDMYRAVIEHPDFMPTELKTRKDLRLGNDLGRIYRVGSPSQVPSPKRQRTPNIWNGETMAEMLASSNGWQRDTAFRLLSDGTVTVTDEELRSWLDSESDLVSVRAFWLLARRGAVDVATMGEILQSGRPRLVEAGLQWSRRAKLDSKVADDVWDDILKLEDPSVLRELALTLSVVDGKSKIRRLEQIVLRTEGEVAASSIQIGVGAQPHKLLERLLSRYSTEEVWDPSKQASVLTGLATMAGRSQTAAVKQNAWKNLVKEFSLEDAYCLDSIRLGFLKSSGYARALTQGKRPGGWTDEDQDWIDTWLQHQWARATDDTIAQRDRLLAIRCFAEVSSDVTPLVALVSEDPLLEIRKTASRQLSRLSVEALWIEVWEKYRGESPDVRQAMLQSAMNSSLGQKTLLDSIDQGIIHVAEIDAATRRRLDQSPPEIALVWKRLASRLVTEDRQALLKRYESHLTTDGSAIKGRELFSKTCANCHRIGDLGVNVAPDISDSRVKTPQQILTDILIPNQSIDGNYVGYVVSTVDGGNWSGVLTGDQGNAVTLRIAGGESVTVLKSDIDTLQSTGLSLMPEGLEQNLTPDEMNDLVSFIKNWRYLDGAIPLEECP